MYLNTQFLNKKKYLEQTIGKIENEIKVRAMRPHKVTV